jgi:hypothetical protein
MVEMSGSTYSRFVRSVAFLIILIVFFCGRTFAQFGDSSQALSRLQQILDDSKKNRRKSRVEYWREHINKIEQHTRNIELLESRIVRDGVGDKAVTEAKRLMMEMLSGAEPQMVRNLVDKKIFLVIIPKGKKLTDLGWYLGWDNLDWIYGGYHLRKVIGRADIRQFNNSVAFVVPEENLDVSDYSYVSDRYGHFKDSTFIHELAHMVQDYGLSKEMRNKSMLLCKDVFKVVSPGLVEKS